MRERFWQRIALEDLSDQEWEALCDGCGRCCLMKLQDEDTQAVYYTGIACRCLDLQTVRCSDYTERLKQVPDCLRITLPLAREGSWLPESCAYRRLAAGQQLADWHPLVSGDPESVVRAGISVRGKVMPETAVDENEYEEHVVHWVT